MAQIIPLLGGVRVGPFPRFHEDKGREISVNISRITDLPTPKPKRDFRNLYRLLYIIGLLCLFLLLGNGFLGKQLIKELSCLDEDVHLLVRQIAM